MITPTRHIEATFPGLIVAGVDEVGRGCLAGPVVAAAVILKPALDIPLLRDSKKLSKRQHKLIAKQVRQQARAVGLGWVAAAEVDARGLGWAVKESGLRALRDLGEVPEVVILDGNHNYLQDTEYLSQAHVGADAHEACVAAASVVAKYARDCYMELAALAYPGYGFESHVGYGAAKHKSALIEFGVTPLHRKSFAGVLQ